FQSLHDIIYSGADSCIVEGDVGMFNKIFAVGVRIFSAISRTYFVDAAIVICSEEGTGLAFIDIISIFIYPKIFISKRSFFHAKMLGNPFYISCVVSWADGFTAVSTLQAVDMGESFVM